MIKLLRSFGVSSAAVSVSGDMLDCSKDDQPNLGSSSSNVLNEEHTAYEHSSSWHCHCFQCSADLLDAKKLSTSTRNPKRRLDIYRGLQTVFVKKYSEFKEITHRVEHLNFISESFRNYKEMWKAGFAVARQLSRREMPCSLENIIAFLHVTQAMNIYLEEDGQESFNKDDFFVDLED